MSIEKTEKFEKYREGALDFEQKKEFDTRLAKDLDFYNEYNNYLLLVNGIENASRNRFKKMFRDTDAEMPEFKETKNGKIIPFQFKKVLPIAASILIAIGLIWFFNHSNKVNPPGIYTAYFEPYPALRSSTDRGPQKEDLITQDKAFEAYRNKDYLKAIDLFKQIENYTINQDIIFYLGNASMATNDFKSAIRYFEKIKNTNDVLGIRVKWYLSLCYLKENETGKARPILEELAKSDNYYSEKSKEILNKL